MRVFHRNFACRLCTISAKQYTRSGRICETTKIYFCTKITPLLIHRWMCRNFWVKPTHRYDESPYLSDLVSCDFFLLPKLKRPMNGRRFATIVIVLSEKAELQEELNKIRKMTFFLNVLSNILLTNHFLIKNKKSY